MRSGSIVFVVADRIAQVVLLPVYLLMLLRSQAASVGLTFRAHLAIYVSFAPFQIAGFVRVQPARRNAVRDAALLIEAPSVYRVHCRGRGTAIVRRRQLGVVPGRHLLMQHLVRGRLEMLFARRHLVLWSCPGRYTSRAIEACAIHDRGVVDNRAVHINVADDSGVDVDYRCVIAEGVPRPDTSEEADSSVTEAVIDAPIEADVRSPVSRMPCINASAEAPVSGSPEYADAWRRDPHTRHPEVTFGPPGPIARSPEIPVPRAGRLSVNGQRGRRHINRDINPRL